MCCQYMGFYGKETDDSMFFFWGKALAVPSFIEYDHAQSIYILSTFPNDEENKYVYFL